MCEAIRKIDSKEVDVEALLDPFMINVVEAQITATFINSH